MGRINEEIFRQRIDKIVSEAYLNQIEDIRARRMQYLQVEAEKKMRLIDELSEAIIKIYGDIPINKRVLNFAIDPIIKQIHSWERDNRFR